jgi:hypothetical protein
MIHQCSRGDAISLSALGGGEGRGEVGDSRALAGTHLTLPIPTDQVRGLKAHDAMDPLPLPPEGRRGHICAAIQ